MPFTFAHPAAVFPFAKLPRKYVSLTGLVIGSMVPDAEYFIRMQVYSRDFHTVPGLLYFDLPVGMILYILYRYILRESVITHLPDFLYKRFAPVKADNDIFRSLSGWLVIAVSIFVGAGIHLLWDSFTHFRGYFVRSYAPLQAELVTRRFQIHVFEILQHTSTAFGMLFIAWVVYKLPVSEAYSARFKYRYYWLIVFNVTVLVVALKYFLSKTIIIGDIIVSSITALFLGLLVASIIYLILKRKWVVATVSSSR